MKVVNHLDANLNQIFFWEKRSLLLLQRGYMIVTPPGIPSLTCHLLNLIYLITFYWCHRQEFGKTVQLVSERLNWHKSEMLYTFNGQYRDFLDKAIKDGLSIQTK